MDSAGLALAVFDLVCKTTKKTHEVIRNYRNFDEESLELAQQVIEEYDRTRTLKCLLFEPATAYNGQCLFSQFHSDVQRQIKLRERKALKIIEEAAELVEEQQANETSEFDTASNGHDSLQTPSAAGPRRKSSPRIRWKWALWEKRKLVSIIGDFAKTNDQIHVQIQLLCHASSVGVDLKHLDRLANDEYSKKLGFDLQAELHLKITSLSPPASSLELKDETLFRGLSASVPIGGNFCVVGENLPSLAEFRNYAPDRREYTPLTGRTRDRVERLAHLLRQEKGTGFRTLSCKGWSLDAQLNRVAFLFELPEGMEGTPCSLLKAYALKKRPNLGERFELAKQLAISISELHQVDWVHESFRSENIIILPRCLRPKEETSTEERLVFTKPWVVGFEFSRPELDFSSGREDRDPARNVYRHPERQNQPQKPFSRIHDIYALGVVLLEIGLWHPVLSLADFRNGTDPRSIQNYLVRKAGKALPRHVGEKYAHLVVRCLTGSFGIDDDGVHSFKLQQAFREQVVDVLQYAADSIG